MLPEDTPMDDSPLEYKPKTVSFPQISEEMVASIALGMEDELIVASRHGMSVEEYTDLAAQPWFQLQVQVKRSEYEKNGVTFKAKAAWMAGELLDQVYVTAASGDASLSQKHEVLKTLIKAAGLEPKEEKVKDVGPGFSISIDLGGGQSVSLTNQQSFTPVTLDAEVKEIKNA
jgi:hypothetical protein